ncbi:MAG TPA: hypothetical protein VFA75_12460 [Nevskia sp.]|nr:hypothetical protein [Nevskia sp.]
MSAKNLTANTLCAWAVVLSGCDKSAIMPAIRMSFVDSATNAPVSEANVVFSAHAHRGTITGDGGEPTTLFLVEATTNKDGSLSIPAQPFPYAPFGMNTNYDYAKLVVFKPGYKVWSVSNMSSSGSLTDLKKWYYNNQQVKISTTSTESEEAEALDWAAGEIGDAATSYPCGWTRIPKSLKAIDTAVDIWSKGRESDKSSGSPYPIYRFDNRRISSPLKQLLSEQLDPIHKDCIAPTAYFAGAQR